MGLRSQDVKRFLLDAGADLVGIASHDRFAELTPGTRPIDLLKHCKSVIVFAKRVPFGSATPHPSISAMEFGDFIPEAVLNDIAYRAALWMEDNGAITMPTPSGRDVVGLDILREAPAPEIKMRGSFDLRFAAVQAGLGRIGANNMVVTEKSGSRVRLGALLTVADLAPDPPQPYGRIPDFCVACGFRCVAACPAQALRGTGGVDHYRCLVIRPDLVAPDRVVADLRKQYSARPLVLAAKQLSYTDSPPHPCATCTTLCPMDHARTLTVDPFYRETWNEYDVAQVFGDPAVGFDRR